MNQESFIENKRSRERLWMRERQWCVRPGRVCGTTRLPREEEGFSQAGNSPASSPVRPFNKKTRKGASDGRNSSGVLSEARPAADDQMEPDSDMYSERENSSGAKAEMDREDQSCGQQGRLK